MTFTDILKNKSIIIAIFIAILLGLLIYFIYLIINVIKQAVVVNTIEQKKKQKQILSESLPSHESFIMSKYEPFTSSNASKTSKEQVLFNYSNTNGLVYCSANPEKSLQIKKCIENTFTLLIDPLPYVINYDESQSKYFDEIGITGMSGFTGPVNVDSFYNVFVPNQKIEINMPDGNKIVTDPILFIYSVVKTYYTIFKQIQNSFNDKVNYNYFFFKIMDPNDIWSGLINILTIIEIKKEINLSQLETAFTLLCVSYLNMIASFDVIFYDSNNNTIYYIIPPENVKGEMDLLLKKIFGDKQNLTPSQLFSIFKQINSSSKYKSGNDLKFPIIKSISQMYKNDNTFINIFNTEDPSNLNCTILSDKLA